VNAAVSARATGRRSSDGPWAGERRTPAQRTSDDAGPWETDHPMKRRTWTGMGGPRLAAIALPVVAVLSIAFGAAIDVAAAAPVAGADLAAAVPAQSGPTSSAPATPVASPGATSGAPSAASPTAATTVTATS